VVNENHNINKQGGKLLINKEMRQFPIIYSSIQGQYAIGWGAHTTVADECKKANIKKALIVTSGLKGTGIIDEIKGILEYNGVSTAVYDKVTSNPKDYQVMEAYKVFKEAECDGVVSVGGGSSHDCGKGARAVATNDGKDVSELINLGDEPWMKAVLRFKPITIPQVAVNTTAGTGAETSDAAFLTDTKAGAKKGCRMRGMAPKIGIVDPLLVRLMPEKVAAWTGWDALTHAFESILSRIWVPHTVFMQLGVVKIIYENLREFTHNRMNHEACENMCWAESMGGFAIMFGGGPGGKFSCHSIGHQIGATTDGHHGLLNAALTIPVERINEPMFPGKFADMTRTMGVDTRGMTRIQAADRWFDEMERLLTDLGIKSGHLTEQVGFQQKDIDHVLDAMISDTFMVHISPGEEERFRSETRQLLESML
jgi:alcohol dehydrogenase class IV